MRSPRLVLRRHAAAVGALLTALVTFQPAGARAQGCAPSRFASPILGAQGDVYQSRHTWQIGLAYRGLTSDQLIIGHRVRNDLAQNGRPSVVKTQSVFTSLTYGVTSRLSMTLNAPFSKGSHETTYPDGLRHENNAAGLGEMSLSASYWLRGTQALQPRGNVAVGLGVKIPTGQYKAAGKSWRADGSSVSFPVHQSIELGDSGVGYIVSALGFEPILERTYVFAGGSYTLNPKKTSGIARSLGSTLQWAVPDTWEASMGASTLISPEHGFSLSVGTLFNGTPKQDLIGGKDDFHRLPAITGYLSPGTSMTRGSNTISLSVPVRFYMDFQPSYADEAAGRSGGGGLARYMIMSSYSVRF